MARWTTTDSEELYQIPAWGKGWFSVNDKGNLEMCPPGEKGGVDLKVLVDDIVRRGIEMPVLIRFSDLIRARVENLVKAFEKAFEEYEYKGRFRGVYPIKVNQDAHVVGDFVKYAAPYHLGLEAGSKPELQVVLAMLEDPEALIICNGYKDREYIQMALLARKLGRNCIIVVEKMDELETIQSVAKELDLEPVIGVRAKLTTKGSGRWQSSVGDRAKFGLTVREIVEVVRKLRDADMLGSLQLLHFHIGSQVTNIRAFNTALREASRVYTELHRLGANMRYLDVGGGLGVDYDGSRTNFESSMNYSVEEYAASVIATIVDACDQAGIAHPDIITEAGRAMIAHHAALVFDVVGVTRMVSEKNPRAPKDDACEELQELWEVYRSITGKNLLEPLHDAMEIREQSLMKFNLGLIDLEERADVDALYFAICKKLYKTADRAADLPEEIEPLEKALADIYYCNFSLFQSAPDSWAIGQLFPICPIHKLDTEPDRRAVIADMTCDSDGKIERFIDRRDVKNTLEVHDPGGEHYYLGMFLVGAYQEILGDLHNLFGDTHVVHVVVGEGKGRKGYKIDAVIEGNVVREVLEYVSYNRDRLVKRLRGWVEEAIEDGRLSPEEGGLLVKSYIQGLEGYTYLG
ncbi:MAG: biosynthetic arginine decarboxylase [Alphaproteobacteria bacterium]|nr:biosynthetic arginine decarboxylase [Alphaproteobacteria bacterium]MCB9695955.1 biosynthetic arginine decarboxylase [Alphaproteobacteria bacterium]